MILILHQNHIQLSVFRFFLIRFSMNRLCPSVLPTFGLVGPSGLEPPTSCLSGTRSNLLSYDPLWLVSDFLSLGCGIRCFLVGIITVIESKRLLIFGVI